MVKLNFASNFSFSLAWRLVSGGVSGSAGVNANSGSSRMTSNSLSTQNNNSTRQQSNHNPASILDDAATHSNAAGAIVLPQQIHLTDMPLEIFERIFQYTGYKEVSNMRLVNISVFLFNSCFFAALSYKTLRRQAQLQRAVLLCAHFYSF